MKKIAILLTFLMVSTFISCNKSSIEDGFEGANSNVKEKLLEQVTYDGSNAYNSSYSYQLEYDGQNHLCCATFNSDRYGNKDTQTSLLNYDSEGNLSNITGSDTPIKMSDLYETPYDAYELGDVLEYDKKGNPTKVEAFANTNLNDTEEMLTAVISYDDKPNPFYYTLKAGGFIDVLDNIDLKFGPESPDLVKAYKLLPFNNINGVTFKSSDGLVQAEILFDTTYDDDGYATNSTVTYVTQSGTNKSYIAYVYK